MSLANYKDSPFNSWYDFKKHYTEWHKTRLCKLIYLVSGVFFLILLIIVSIKIKKANDLRRANEEYMLYFEKLKINLDTFQRVLNVPPNWSKYNMTLAEYEYPAKFFWDEPLAGGSILKPTRIKYSNDTIPNSLN